ncbi:hypothetical protein WUBG_15316 [Wuchereria bancrofti]|uniref:Uncharacterized protein n=1 Tax=Wuchereria bancrofti TaxID=6293 RepID=J9E9W2_WUCBA|nr:hypothetical protein WUBG_15316 [Wuchereria bancrofti]
MVTDKRISLSPIPLNLIEVDNELAAGDGKGIASDGTDVARNVNNDSITFRVNHNAAKRSSKGRQGFTPPLLRRSENYERRRHSSLSPHSHSGNQFSSVVQLNGIESSPVGKQIPITSSEILNQYRIDAEGFAVAERNLRSWICQTILRPLLVKIDEINASHAHLHLKIGHSSVEALQTAASSKSDLLKSALPYILPQRSEKYHNIHTVVGDGKESMFVKHNVHMYTGSRIMVTDKRISLSPIPLNLIEVDNELAAGDGKGIASDGTDVARNVNNDSITFRVNHNAAKRSSKGRQGL